MMSDRRALNDRLFHDRLYAAHRGNFLTMGFTNFVSIRRNYEDIREYLLPCKRIIDLGCGGGYDLQYMAQQHPDKEFWGFDHSERAVQRASEHARRIGLSNVRFETANILQLDPDITADLVILKDAFHHVVDPARLIADLECRTARVILVEPSGFGYAMDCDDLLYRLHELGHMLDGWIPVPSCENREGNGALEQARSNGEHTEPEGEPLENRYTLKEIEEFFHGWKLEAKGTLSIFSIWEPWFQSDDPGNELTNRLALTVYRDLDNRLRKAGVDLEAKHLIIYASREDEPDHSFDGFARLESGRSVLAGWRSRRLEAEYPGRRIAYDFLVSLTNAVQHAGGKEFIQSGRLRIENIQRDFLFEHPDSSIEYTLTVPPKAEFRGYLGLNPAAWLDRGGRGVVFRLDIVAGGDRASLFGGLVDPRNRVEDRCWRPCVVDLSGFAGRSVTLILSTEAPAGARDFCWSGWGDPVLIVPKE